VPDIWRLQSPSNKQASQLDEHGNPIVNEAIQEWACKEYADFIASLDLKVKAFIAKGIAKEQAQIMLPISFYTEIYWTASFQAIMNFIELRNDNHAQWEIRQYALALLRIMEQLFPVCTNAWLENS
jgi:thymidylate synthase (FAD)